jgi:hypothetical protein
VARVLVPHQSKGGWPAAGDRASQRARRERGALGRDKTRVSAPHRLGDPVVDRTAEELEIPEYAAATIAATCAA